MRREFSVANLRKAVDEAYELFKNVAEGEVDPRLKNVNEEAFGISVVLTDGTLINKGDVAVKSPLGNIAKLPLSTILFAQNCPMELMKKLGQCANHSEPKKPKHLGLSAKGIREFSAVKPIGDPESKWSMFADRMIAMMGTAPELDDQLYQAIRMDAKVQGIENLMAEAGYYLYDDAAMSIDLYARAVALTASTEQLAVMGATIANNGKNPMTGKGVFDGKLSRYVVAMMAADGPHKMRIPWLVNTGLPAKSSFGGGFVGVFPGLMSIAAYSPRLNRARAGIKAYQAIAAIMQQLDLSIFASC